LLHYLQVTFKTEQELDEKPISIKNLIQPTRTDQEVIQQLCNHHYLTNPANVSGLLAHFNAQQDTEFKRMTHIACKNTMLTSIAQRDHNSHKVKVCACGVYGCTTCATATFLSLFLCNHPSWPLIACTTASFTESIFGVVSCLTFNQAQAHLLQMTPEELSDILQALENDKQKPKE